MRMRGTHEEEEGAADVATPIDFLDFFSVVLIVSSVPLAMK
jgi:hypothetical protein